MSDQPEARLLSATVPDSTVGLARCAHESATAALLFMLDRIHARGIGLEFGDVDREASAAATIGAALFALGEVLDELEKGTPEGEERARNGAEPWRQVKP